MGSLTRVDPVAGLAFFRRGPLFACALAVPTPADARRCALLACAVEPGDDAFEQALALARSIGGRQHAMVVERVLAVTQHWPSREPLPAASYMVERGGFVVLAPSVEAWVHMPPARPHHLVQLVAALPHGEEAAARAALASLDGCGLLGRVRAVLLGDSGAEIDAVVGGPDGLRAGWFTPAGAGPRDDTPAMGGGAGASPAPEALPASDRVTVAPTPPGPAPIRYHDRAALLNDALAAYLAPPGGMRRLEAFLQEAAPAADAAEVQAALDAAVAATTDHLWAQQPGVSWNDAFERQLFEHVQARHPWLAAPGFAALLRHAKWFCWHEGLGVDS